MALSLCGMAFVHQSQGLFDLEQGSVGWNQFSNLYSNWVELEYPHGKSSGTKHHPLTGSELAAGGGSRGLDALLII